MGQFFPFFPLKWDFFEKNYEYKKVVVKYVLTISNMLKVK